MFSCNKTYIINGGFFYNSLDWFQMKRYTWLLNLPHLAHEVS